MFKKTFILLPLLLAVACAGPGMGSCCSSGKHSCCTSKSACCDMKDCCKGDGEAMCPMKDKKQ